MGLEDHAGESLSGSTEFTFDNKSGEASTEGLKIVNSKDYFKYLLKLKVVSDPPIYEGVVVLSPYVQVRVLSSAAFCWFR